MKIFKRLLFVLIVGTVALFSLINSLGQPAIKTAFSPDSRNRIWSNITGNNLLERKGNRFNLTFDSNRLNKLVTTRKPANSIAGKWSGIENFPRPFKKIKIENRHDRDFLAVNAVSKSNKVNLKSNVTHRKQRVDNSRLINMKSIHPNEKDREMIASGRYKAEDLMSAGPFKFLKNYKNPCWIPVHRKKTEPAIQCLPYFYLIGAPKAGTTNLYKRLIQHPDVSKHVVKEPHWISRKHYYMSAVQNSSGLLDYLKIFAKATREIYLKQDANGYHNKIFGDCSASTMWDNDYWTILPQYKNLSEPKYTNADYIYHLNPKTKIIAMLRDPVDRLYSDFLYFEHGSPRLFHEGVIYVINSTKECLKHNSLRHCLYKLLYNPIYPHVRLRIGVYHQHLKEYFRVFPRDQVLVIKLEDYSEKTVAYMKKIFTFLKLPALKENDLLRIANPKIHDNQRKKTDRKAGKMFPETRQMLKTFYRRHNELLTELLGGLFNYN